MASDSASSDTELLTEHFGYPPVSLLDDIINSVNILAERALTSVEQGLLNAPPQTLGFRPASRTASSPAETAALAEQHKHEVENGTHQLETLLCASIDRNFDLFELYAMRNILCVAPADRDFVRLAHYEGLSFAPPPDAPTVESVTALRRKLQASQRLTVMLEAEKARNAALLTQLRDIVGAPAAAVADPADHAAATPAASPGPLAFLRARGGLAAADADAPLATTAAFALSQLQALRALSASLRTILPDLAEPLPGEAPGGSWRRERAEYVDGETRKHLESVRGLELGAQGAVRDGEWQGEGRALARGEVEGLEKVVAILGGSGGGGGKGQDEMDES